MKQQNSFYRIDAATALEAIDAFFAKRDQFDNEVLALCEKFGAPMFSSSDSILGGLRFHHMVVPTTSVVDATKFKTSRNHDRSYLNIMPRKANKEFYAEFEQMLPKPVPYDDLSRIILDGECEIRHMIISGYGYRYRKGQPFYFSTSLPPSKLAIEVVASEYNNAYNDE